LNPHKARARAFIDSSVLPTIQAGLETYPYDDVPDVLARCREALANDLAWEFEDMGQRLVKEAFDDE
jgi:hypothetical protein